MEFRPCIDIHNGKVKQIVGASLSDADSSARENFVSGKDAAFYARLYQKDHIRGGHIILLNPRGTQYYEADQKQAVQALSAYPGGLQVGGGITPDSAREFLQAGASHVIVTSYVFQDGRIHYGNLEKLAAAAGKEHLVLDLSCRRVDGVELQVCPYSRYVEFKKSSYNINEPCSNPVSAEVLDLVIVPALAVDKDGYRLGYGGGFYDRFLPKCLSATTLVPICEDFVLNELPREEFDCKVDYIITNGKKAHC